MSARRISIDWEALEIAVERNSPDTDSFLETSSGQVIVIVAGDPEAAQLKARVAANITGYLRVEPASSREQYRWMERFVSSVAEEPLRHRLVISIDGKGAFRRFKDVLLAYPAERERWFSYRSNLLHWHIQNWLEGNDVEGENPSPWGDLSEPQELESMAADEDVPVGAPGEALRRTAKELVDGIAPLDLPTAIAFLEFLRERNTAAIVHLVEDPEVIVADKVAVGPSIVR